MTIKNYSKLEYLINSKLFANQKNSISIKEIEDLLKGISPIEIIEFCDEYLKNNKNITIEDYDKYKSLTLCY